MVQTVCLGGLRDSRGSSTCSAPWFVAVWEQGGCSYQDHASPWPKEVAPNEGSWLLWQLRQLELQRCHVPHLSPVKLASLASLRLLMLHMPDMSLRKEWRLHFLRHRRAPRLTHGIKKSVRVLVRRPSWQGLLLLLDMVRKNVVEKVALVALLAWVHLLSWRKLQPMQLSQQSFLSSMWRTVEVSAFCANCSLPTTVWLQQRPFFPWDNGHIWS